MVMGVGIWRHCEEDPADHFLKILVDCEPKFKSGEHVRSEFERLRKLVRECDEALLAVVMSFWKWKQNESYTSKTIAIAEGTEWKLGRDARSCPLCIVNFDDDYCEKCALDTIGGCDSDDYYPSPYDYTSPQRGADKKPLLIAIKKAIAYEIKRHKDYDLEALRSALAGEEETIEVIADEDEKGEYWARCSPHGELWKNYLGEDASRRCFPCRAGCRIRRRTRYERWTEEETELWCVTSCGPSNGYDIYECKMGRLDQGREGGNVEIGNYTLRVPADVTVPYLGESRNKAFEIACEKWAQIGTSLYVVEKRTEIYFMAYQITTATIRYNPLVECNEIYFDGGSDSSGNWEARCIGKDQGRMVTPDINRAIDWLRERLEK